MVKEVLASGKNGKNKSILLVLLRLQIKTWLADFINFLVVACIYAKKDKLITKIRGDGVSMVKGLELV